MFRKKFCIILLVVPLYPRFWVKLRDNRNLTNFTFHPESLIQSHVRLLIRRMQPISQLVRDLFDDLLFGSTVQSLIYI